MCPGFCAKDVSRMADWDGFQCCWVMSPTMLVVPRNDLVVRSIQLHAQKNPAKSPYGAGDKLDDELDLLQVVHSLFLPVHGKRIWRARNASKKGGCGLLESLETSKH